VSGPFSAGGRSFFHSGSRDRMRAMFGRKFERQFKRRDESNVNAVAENRRRLTQKRRF
jgi:hypothetical protein